MPPQPSFLPIRQLLALNRPSVCSSCSRRFQPSPSSKDSTGRHFSILSPLCRPDISSPSTNSTSSTPTPVAPAIRIAKIITKDAEKPPAKEAHAKRPIPAEDIEPWMLHKAALKEKLNGEQWRPTKRLSPDALDGIRALHQQYPERYTTPVLAKQFEVSTEAIRRILKGKWRPTGDEADDRRKRWERRGKKIWEERAEKGEKPPQKWRAEGVGRVKEGEGVPRWKRAQWTKENALNVAIKGGRSGEAISDTKEKAEVAEIQGWRSGAL